MLTFADIESRPYQNFINTLKSNFTKETYEFHLRKFMAEFPNLTIESFLELPINEVEEKIVDYILKLKKEGLSSIYIRLKLSTIKHLCV
ncbi:MAG: hypothetical protein WBQ16_00005, partial [Nitrososphaeraceae archaeon]